MKKVYLIALLAVSGLCLNAQKLDKAKELLDKKKDLAEAKNEIEGVLANEKNKSNSEAWYVKSKIYLAISKDSALKGTMPDARNTALESLRTYLELEKNVKDSLKRDMALTLDNNAPLADLYLGYNRDAATYFNANNYNDALTNFAKSLEVFEILRDKKVTPVVFDTTSTLYAGVSAEKAKKPEEAAKYYGQIAERKVKSEGFVDIYKWLANYYQEKNDLATSSKFIKLGSEVYPEDPFWSAYELDMIREKGTKQDLFKKYDDIIAANPDNHLFLFNYAVELYQEGYNDTISKRPANSKELIEKAGQLLAKVEQMKPDYANAQVVLGQISYNQGVDLDKENKTIRPPQGGKLKPEDLKKKEELRQAMFAKFDEAIPHFAKVEQILEPQGKLKVDEKGSLKTSLDLLINMYEQKQNYLEQKKSKAEAAKNSAEAKKLDAELKDIQAKLTDYTDKYNNVDKKH